MWGCTITYSDELEFFQMWDNIQLEHVKVGLPCNGLCIKEKWVSHLLMHTLFQLRDNLTKTAHFYQFLLKHKKFVILEHTLVDILYNEEFFIW